METRKREPLCISTTSANRRIACHVSQNDASRRVVTNPWPVAWSDPTLYHGRKPQGISHDHHPPSASLGSRDQTNRLPIALQIIRTIGTRPFLHLAWLRTAFDSYDDLDETPVWKLLELLGSDYSLFFSRVMMPSI